MLKSLLKAMRPKQWAKNVFVLAGIVFDGRLFDTRRLLNSLIALGLFCLLSSAVYLINDLVDIENDRRHPTKRHRPLASGALQPWVAIIACAVILLAGIPAAFVLNISFGLIATVYVVTMVLYSFWLKHMVIIDVMTIAAGFVLRVMAGTAAAQVTRFSPWLYVCTTLLALFIAINKRRHELVLMARDANHHRSILEQYNLGLLDDMTSVVISTVLAAYSFYTFSAPNLPQNHAMMLTIPFVLYGLFRYLYLVRVKNKGGAPEDIALGDRPLLACLALWAITAALVIYIRF